jgi:hypothetical protein
MRVWYALLDGRSHDVALVKHHFSSSKLEFNEMDGKTSLSSPAFESSHDSGEAIDKVTSFIADMNTALLISEPGYVPLNLHGLIEMRGDTKHRIMFAQGASFGISGVSAVATAGTLGAPVRTKEEAPHRAYFRESGGCRHSPRTREPPGDLGHNPKSL